jgi:GalNAc-alpha-(1->4)-GalNAc-alpha-(1->3)-diNAcBac-PP-undecaprenol alpha-1,4-N-acetyl-D-galactosaminyltransferase
MRLTIVNSDLAGGGAERALCLLANHWAQSGHTVNLLLLADEQSFYPLDMRVLVRALHLAGASKNSWQAARANWQRVAALRRAIRDTRPDLVLSFTLQTNVKTVLALTATGIPVVIGERTDPTKRSFGRSWDWLCRFTYPRAAAVQCMTREIAAWLTDGGCSRVAVIPNGIFIPRGSAPVMACLPGKRRIAAMGRLHPVKGFDKLLRVFQQLRTRHQDLGLVLIGEGGERQALEHLARELQISEHVYFAGHIANPFSLLRQCDLFVLSSLCEAFPNALCEAMACGLPAAALDCSGAVSEIICPGENGVILPAGDFDGLSREIDGLFRDDETRIAMGKQAPRILDKFSMDRFYRNWDKLLDDALSDCEPRRQPVWANGD